MDSADNLPLGVPPHVKAQRERVARAEFDGRRRSEFSVRWALHQASRTVEGLPVSGAARQALRRRLRGRR